MLSFSVDASPSACSRRRYSSAASASAVSPTQHLETRRPSPIRQSVAANAEIERLREQVFTAVEKEHNAVAHIHKLQNMLAIAQKQVHKRFYCSL
jgi:hypothetical protein